MRAHAAFADRIVIGWDVGIMPDGPELVEENGGPDLDVRHSASIATLALAVRPAPAAIVKLEYVIAGRSAPGAEPGFKASIATLF